MAKLSYKDHESDQKVMLEFCDGSTTHEFLQSVKQMMLGIGYHPDSVKEAFLDMATDYRIIDGDLPEQSIPEHLNPEDIDEE